MTMMESISVPESLPGNTRHSDLRDPRLAPCTAVSVEFMIIEYFRYIQHYTRVYADAHCRKFTDELGSLRTEARSQLETVVRPRIAGRDFVSECEHPRHVGREREPSGTAPSTETHSEGRARDQNRAHTAHRSLGQGANQAQANGGRARESEFPPRARATVRLVSKKARGFSSAARRQTVGWHLGAQAGRAVEARGADTLRERERKTWGSSSRGSSKKKTTPRGVRDERTSANSASSHLAARIHPQAM
ncbi:hypothetical protein DFH09DRAFT_1076477 [Mycena vulgaris]|nr:hypothetical protein DFH09DRAFT_1076477 [Mycena vulgaris]